MRPRTGPITSRGGRRRSRYLFVVAALVVTAWTCSRPAFIPSTKTSRPGVQPSWGALGWWTLATAAHAEEKQEVLRANKLFTSAEEAQAAAEKLKAADASLELLDAPVNLLPPVLPADEKTLDVVKDMGREALRSLSEGDLGAAAGIAGNMVEEGLAAVQEEEFPWDKVGLAFFGFALLANSAQFVYPLLEEILEDDEDDFDRLPMPEGRAPRRPMRVEEVDLKLPPKPMSEAIAEKMEQTKRAKKEKQDFNEDDWKRKRSA